MRKKQADHPIVSLRGVRFHSEDESPLELEFVPGELAFIGRQRQPPEPLIEDLIQGIVPPASGEILFDGLAWGARSTREIEAARLSIGRVFATPTPVSNWVQNLNVTDNVLLAQRFRAHVNEPDLRRRADELAARFGLGSLPSSRPSATPVEQLELAQWVRAFLPDPLRLLILDHPSSGVTEESLAGLLDAVDSTRAKGTAVLWIGRSPSRSIAGGRLSPTQSLTQLADGQIRPEESINHGYPAV